MIPIYTASAAQQTILRREMALEPTIPAGLQASLDRLFGPGATPEEGVRRIIHDVRRRGDAAIY